MLENLPELQGTGHVFQISGKPSDFGDIQALEWCFHMAMGGLNESSEATIEQVWEQAFDLPYDQGAGFTLVEFRRWGFPPTPLDEADIEYKPEPDATGDPNGWEELSIVVTVGYADSMTNVFKSPLYRNRDAHDPYPDFCLGNY